MIQLYQIWFSFHILSKRASNSHQIEPCRIVSWRYQYLIMLNSLKAACYDVIFLDETWYNTHDVVKKGCNSCTLKTSVSLSQQIMVLDAGSHEGWVSNCSYISSKKLGIQKQIHIMKQILTFLKTDFKIHFYTLYHQI